MKIHLAKSAGFCFGVRRAIQLAFATAGSNKTVCMLGDIVHNEDVVREIQSRGIKKIGSLKPGKSSILLIRAHGTPPSIPEKARGLGYEIVDATCPMVQEIHKIAREMEKQGNTIIVIGDKKHDEVRGIVGQLRNKAVVIDDADAIPNAKLKKIKKACVVVQSTQNIDKVLKIVQRLKRHVPGLIFSNTICKPTRLRQDEVKKMAQACDRMIIIGSKKSANTRRLYEISRSLNAHSYCVASKNELRKEWFKGAESVGVTAGASTPDTTTQQVVSAIKTLSS